MGLAAYFLAIFHRSSLSVAGLEATDRFGLSASGLATFTMLQLLVYAAMQVPVGLLIDRFGSRSILLGGVLVCSAAQAGFAFAESYPQALIARFFVGVGDAMTFICVIRLVAAWFPGRQVPLVTTLTGTIGQGGAIVAAVPVTLALRHWGWTSTYLTAALLGPLVALLLALLLHDSPEGKHLRGAPMNLRSVRRSLGASWGHPGTRLGFWIHFTTCFSTHAISLLWGLPFMVRSEGLSEEAAGTLLTLFVVVAMCSGPAIGWSIGRYPWQRSTIALGACLGVVAAWTLVLCWPGEAPVWTLVVLMVALGVGGPASMIGFDVARTSNPPERQGSASGLVNQGGFIAALLTVLAIGWILDWRSPAGTDYAASAFTWAMSFQYILWAIGLTQILRFRRRARTSLIEEHGGRPTAFDRV